MLPDNDADEFMVTDAAALLHDAEDKSGGSQALTGALDGAPACCFTRDLAHPQLLEFARFVQRQRQQEAEHELADPPDASAPSALGGLPGQAEGWVGAGSSALFASAGGGGVGEQAMECPQVLAALVQVCMAGVCGGAGRGFGREGRMGGGASATRKIRIDPWWVQVCDAALERMSTRIEEDEALLAELPPGRRRLSVE